MTKTVKKVVRKPRLLKVVVDRRKWLRGEGSDESRLLRPADGKMCCIGFACLTAGHTKAQIKNLAQADEVKSLSNKLSTLKRPLPFSGAADVACELYQWNDDASKNDDERELHIIERGKAAGLSFSFTH